MTTENQDYIKENLEIFKAKILKINKIEDEAKKILEYAKSELCILHENKDNIDIDANLHGILVNLQKIFKEKFIKEKFIIEKFIKEFKNIANEIIDKKSNKTIQAKLHLLVQLQNMKYNYISLSSKNVELPTELHSVSNEVINFFAETYKNIISSNDLQVIYVTLGKISRLLENKELKPSDIISQIKDIEIFGHKVNSENLAQIRNKLDATLSRSELENMLSAENRSINNIDLSEEDEYLIKEALELINIYEKFVNTVEKNFFFIVNPKELGQLKTALADNNSVLAKNIKEIKETEAIKIEDINEKLEKACNDHKSDLISMLQKSYSKFAPFLYYKSEYLGKRVKTSKSKIYSLAALSFLFGIAGLVIGLTQSLALKLTAMTPSFIPLILIAFSLGYFAYLKYKKINLSDILGSNRKISSLLNYLVPALLFLTPYLTEHTLLGRHIPVTLLVVGAITTLIAALGLYLRNKAISEQIIDCLNTSGATKEPVKGTHAVSQGIQKSNSTSDNGELDKSKEPSKEETEKQVSDNDPEPNPTGAMYR